jgi:hypothetical protein
MRYHSVLYYTEISHQDFVRIYAGRIVCNVLRSGTHEAYVRHIKNLTYTYFHRFTTQSWMKAVRS